MAYTENEIYYPYDYDASADVPEDMKTMAESIDEVIGEIKGTQTSQNNRLSTLETGQTSQGTRITNLETDNTTNKTNITSLQEGEVTQNNRLSTLETDNTTNKTNITNLQNAQTTQSATIQSLQAENTRLKKNQIYGTATGIEVEITDSAEMEASIGVGGNSTQDGEPSPSNRYEIKNLTGNTICTVTNANNQEKSVTFPLGEQKLAKGDYLASDGIHIVKRPLSFSGAELGWNLSYTEKVPYITLTNVKIPDDNIAANASCTDYKVMKRIGLTDGNFAISSSQAFIFYDETYKNDLNSWKTHLAELYENNTPLIVEYELNQETVIPYTQAQQEAWNELQNILFYEGYNHIEMTSSNGVNANLTVNYTKITQMVINDIEERLSVLEYAGLEG